MLVIQDEIKMNSNNHGGARRGAGRKADKDTQDLRELMAAVWSPDAREAALFQIAAKAEHGDLSAMKLLMAYAYGTPPSGDELRVQEAVDNAVETLLQSLEAQLTPDAWAQVETALEIDGD